MALIDLVSVDIVKIPLDSTDKPDVLRELVQVLKDAGGIEDFDTALKAVQDREDKQSTGLERGIAVPHGKTDAVSSLKLVIGIAPQGIDFEINSLGSGTLTSVLSSLLFRCNRPAIGID